MTAHSYQAFICILIGHQDVETRLQLGKIITEEVKARKCARCGRISVPRSELGLLKE